MINYIPILVAAIAAFVVGILWHGPLFGNVWMRLMKLNKADMKKMKLSPQQAMTGGFVSLLVVSSVISFFIASSNATTMPSAAKLTFLLWLGFTAPILFGSFLWENKPFKLVAFNAAYRFVELFIMTIVLALWH